MNWYKDLINYFKARRKGTTPKVSVLIWDNINSDFLDKQLHVDIYLPPKGSYHLFQSPGLLILNDGQDLKTMNFTKILEDLYASGSIPPIYVAAVHADQDRLYDYGIAHQADYKNRGNKASEYAQFITKELLPKIRNQFKINMPATIAGFSLGGLSAFDICWNQPNLFNKVGVFSGALWWRSKDFDPNDPDANRIAHEMVATSKHRKGLRFWFQTGTKDESSDRNNNGVIDAIDDTLDLIKALKAKGYIKPKGMEYVEVVDGEHNPQTWAKVMPDFLKWAFGK